MKIALGQMNPTVGDLAGNSQIMLRFAERAAAARADIIVFPELSLTGYPPRDLVEKASFLERVEDHLQAMAPKAPLPMIVGYTGRVASATGKQVLNSAAVIDKGQVVFRYSKMLLPIYHVFDDTQWLLR